MPNVFSFSFRGWKVDFCFEDWFSFGCGCAWCIPFVMYQDVCCDKLGYIANLRWECLPLQVLSNDIDLLHPPAELEKRKHKLKRLVQSPNSFFMVL